MAKKVLVVDDEPDLLWALRGGGGNFGVVTSFEFGLHEMQRQVIGGNLVFPISRMRELLAFYADFSLGAPDELYVDAVMRVPPGGKDGAFVIHVCYSGPAADAERVLAPLRKLDAPLADTIKAVDYVALQRAWDDTDPRNEGEYLKSGFINDFPGELVDNWQEKAIDKFFVQEMGFASQAAALTPGLMIGRTPEYLGKKIEPREMTIATIIILIPIFLILIGTAVAVLADPGKTAVLNPGPHGFSEILYAFTSASQNNGSAFGGLSANTPFYNTLLGFAMLLSRYWLMIPVLAIAGSLAAKKIVPASAGTLPTHTPLFVLLLIGTVLMVGALTFVPALALGPVVEQLQMLGVGK